MDKIDSNYIVLKFEVYCTSTRVGEIVKVSGNCPELGDWNAANSLTLITSTSLFPIWKGAILISDKTKMPLEYKYIIVREHGLTVSPVWESFDGNR